MKNSFLLLALIATSLAQTGTTPLANADVRRVGELLKCMCGSCNYTVTSCNMLHCHGAEPMREKLLGMVQKGMSDASVLDAFVKEYGTVVLTKPPAEGFNLLGWVMPFVALALGLAAIVWLIRRYYFRPAAAGATGVNLDPEELARYREQIDKDLAKLD